MNLSPETTYQAIVGSVLVGIRKELGVEQSALAKAVGVNQSTWSRIERGKSALSIEQLFLAANHLQIKPSIVIHNSEKAVQSLRSQKVVVSVSKNMDKRVGQGVALIGASALGALVGAAIIRGKSDKPENE